MLNSTHRFLSFTYKALLEAPYCIIHPKNLINQIYITGTTSLPVISFISIFTGAIISIQVISQLGDYLPILYVGIATEKSVLTELGPVLTSIIIAGRIGGSITAEIGSMTVTEQIDAMKVMNINIFRQIITPRILACFITLPILTIIASFISIVSALLIIELLFPSSANYFLKGVQLFYAFEDIVICLSKATIFGVIIGSISCYWGYSKSKKTGVGQATLQSVMVCNIFILFSAFLVSYFLLK